MIVRFSFQNEQQSNKDEWQNLGESVVDQNTSPEASMHLTPSHRRSAGLMYSNYDGHYFNIQTIRWSFAP